MEDPGEAARHWRLGKRRGAALQAALAAADAAQYLGEKAACLALAAECANGDERDRLALRAARALNRVGRRPQALKALEGAAASEPHLAAQIALERAVALGAWGRLEAMEDEIARGLALLGGGDKREDRQLEVDLRTVRIRWRAAADWGDPWLVEETAAVSVAAERYGIASLELLRCQATILHVTGKYAEAADAARDLIERALAEDRHDLAFDAAVLLIPALQASGEWEESVAVSERLAAVAHGLGLAAREAELRIPIRVYHAFQVERDFAAVVEQASSYLARPWLIGPSADSLTYYLALSHAVTGDLGQARKALDEAAIEGDQARSLLLAARAEVEWLARRPQDTLRYAELSLEIDHASPNRYIAGLAQAWAQLELGQAPTAPTSANGWQVGGEAIEAECEGILALHRKEPERAAEHLRVAARHWLNWEPISALRCRWAAADALAGQGDRASIEELGELERELAELGLPPLLGRVRASLSRWAGRRPTRGKAKAKGESRAGALTPRQREVLSLVAAGLSSDEIAARLGIAKSTVDVLVRRAVQKLGARNRREAALLAEEGS